MGFHEGDKTRNENNVGSPCSSTSPKPAVASNCPSTCSSSEFPPHLPNILKPTVDGGLGMSSSPASSLLPAGLPLALASRHHMDAGDAHRHLFPSGAVTQERAPPPTTGQKRLSESVDETIPKKHFKQNENQHQIPSLHPHNQGICKESFFFN